MTHTWGKGVSLSGYVLTAEARLASMELLSQERRCLLPAEANYPAVGGANSRRERPKKIRNSYLLP